MDSLERALFYDLVGHVLGDRADLMDASNDVRQLVVDEICQAVEAYFRLAPRATPSAGTPEGFKLGEGHKIVIERAARRASERTMKRIRAEIDMDATPPGTVPSSQWAMGPILITKDPSPAVIHLPLSRSEAWAVYRALAYVEGEVMQNQQVLAAGGLGHGRAIDRDAATDKLPRRWAGSRLVNYMRRAGWIPGGGGGEEFKP